MTAQKQSERAAWETLADALGYNGAFRDSFLDGNTIPILFPSDAIKAMLAFAATPPSDGDEVRKLRTAINWIEPPFVDENTSEAELRARISFVIADAKRATPTPDTVTVPRVATEGWRTIESAPKGKANSVIVHAGGLVGRGILPRRR